MARQRRLTATSTIIELVPANPQRESFYVTNVSDKDEIRIYQHKDAPQGGIYIWAHGWRQFEAEDEPEEQWFVKTGGSTIYVHVAEFFKKRRRR